MRFAVIMEAENRKACHTSVKHGKLCQNEKVCNWRVNQNFHNYHRNIVYILALFEGLHSLANENAVEEFIWEIEIKFFYWENGKSQRMLSQLKNMFIFFVVSFVALIATEVVFVLIFLLTWWWFSKSLISNTFISIPFVFIPSRNTLRQWQAKSWRTLICENVIFTQPTTTKDRFFVEIFVNTLTIEGIIFD